MLSRLIITGYSITFFVPQTAALFRIAGSNISAARVLILPAHAGDAIHQRCGKGRGLGSIGAHAQYNTSLLLAGNTVHAKIGSKCQEGTKMIASGRPKSKAVEYSQKGKSERSVKASKVDGGKKKITKKATGQPSALEERRRWWEMVVEGLEVKARPVE